MSTTDLLSAVADAAVTEIAEYRLTDSPEVFAARVRMSVLNAMSRACTIVFAGPTATAASLSPAEKQAAHLSEFGR